MECHASPTAGTSCWCGIPAEIVPSLEKVLDPVISEDEDSFETGLLLPDGPLMGWGLEEEGYEPLATWWDAATRTWSAHSPVLACDILLVQELHTRNRDGGYRIVDADSGEAMSSASENYAVIEEQGAELARQRKYIVEMTADLAASRFGPAVAAELRNLMQRHPARLPTQETMQTWLDAPDSQAFLQLARQHYG
jgi:hypothetical protein